MLVTESAGDRLSALLAERGAKMRIETEFADANGDARALLVFVPDPPVEAAA